MEHDYYKLSRALLGTLITIRDLGTLPEMNAWNLANIAQCILDAAAPALEIDVNSASLVTRLKEEGFALMTGTLPQSEND